MLINSILLLIEFVKKNKLKIILRFLDIFLLILLGWGAYRGFKKGFVLEFFSLISFSIAKVISIKILHVFKTFYSKEHSNLAPTTSYITFGLLFIIIVAIIILLGRFIKSRVNMSLLGRIDKIIGLVIGIGKWAYYVSTFLWLANLFQINLPDNYIANTLLFPVIKTISPSLISLIANLLPTLKEWLEAIK